MRRPLVGAMLALGVCCAVTFAVLLRGIDADDGDAETPDATAYEGEDEPAELPRRTESGGIDSPGRAVAASPPRRERERVGAEKPCTEPHGPVNRVFEITPPDDRSHQWWAVELERLIARNSSELEGDVRLHVHTAIEPDGIGVRLWIDRVPRPVAESALRQLLGRIEARRPERVARDNARTRLENEISASNAKSRIAANDLRYVTESKGVKRETIDASIRTAEAEIEAWMTERAAARAQRDLPGLADAERLELDRYLVAADAELERLTDRLGTLRGVARRVDALEEEMRGLDERKATASRELEELHLWVEPPPLVREAAAFDRK